MEKSEKRIYTVATAHLDTSWLWTLEKTIEEYLPRTLEKNFALFKKYPDYKFNFEGAYRYELIEEYYPELFAKLINYIKEGRWVPCGSSYENGDVNTPSPEALLRNIMYGNRYFKEKFGVLCNDIFLPDCFGFGYALPSVAAHASLKGFSTQKLTWGSAYGAPFDIGKWKGVDGSFLYSALLPFSYTTVLSSVRRNSKYLKKLADNLNKYSLPWTFIYHGTGDRGGSPSEFSVRNMAAELAFNDENDIKVLSASTHEFFEDMSQLPTDIQASLPEWDNELLLTEHGAGSYTARTANKRFNRRNELLADAAERAACTAMCVSGTQYPQYALDSAWKKVLAHHFHDDITGTSFTECYKRSQNDYIQSLNVFSNEYTASCNAVSKALDTSFCKGIPVVVNNPVQCSCDRTEAVYFDLFDSGKKYYRVFDENGEEVFSQNIRKENGAVKVVFLACVPSVGMRVYDVRESYGECTLISGLKVSSSMLENFRYRVFVNTSGDISDIYDKKLKKSVLRAPIRLCILNNTHSDTYPAWEVKYSDVMSPVRETPNKPVITIEEFGPARVALRIERKSRNSSFTQIVSLDEYGDTLKIFNEVDWRDTGSMLKVEFPMACENDSAFYDIGLGAIKRTNNTDKLFEVPAQLWADLTDAGGEFGVSVLSDSKTGWDKPTDNTLRLTAIHTPLSNYRWECSQHLMDFGINRFGFGIYVHEGDFANGTNTAANNFVQPMHTFITTVHKGKLGNSYSFARISKDNLIIRAIKKAQDSDNIVVRVNECAGIKTEGAEITLAGGILNAFEADGTENYIADTQITDGKLVFDIEPFGIKTFVLSVQKQSAKKTKNEINIELPLNITAVTSQNNYQAAGISVPRELIPDTIYSGGIHFLLSHNENKNAVSCNGQEISIPDNVKTLNILAARQGDERISDFSLDGEKIQIFVPSAYKYTGIWDLIALGETGYIDKTPLVFSASHSHCRKGDVTARQYNIYRLQLNVEGKKILTLPHDDSIIIFAITATKENAAFKEGSEHYDSLEKRNFNYILTSDEIKHASPARLEKRLDRIIPRKSTKFIDFPAFSTAIQPAEVYYAVRSGFDKLRMKRIKNLSK